MPRRNSPDPTSIRLTPSLRKRLERHADAEGRYLSAFIVHILEQEMDRRDGRSLPRFGTGEYDV